jgi:cytidine deaminase
MSLLSRKAFFLRSVVTPIPLFLLAACQVFPSVTKGPVPTQDVGEEPPTRLLSPTPSLLTPISTPTRIIDFEPGKMLVGPAPYPTPASMVTPWKQLIDPGLIADLTWEIYRGEMLGKDKGLRWIYSFLYPAGWFFDPKASLIQSFVQNIPLTQVPAASKFVKFEIVRLTAPPMIEEGHAVDPNDLMTVEVAGERGILFSAIQQAGQMRQITVFFQHFGGWLAATGYINLSTADLTQLDRFSAIVFYMLSSFTFSDQAPGSPLLSSGVSVEEHELESAPQVDPLTFGPVQGSQEDILRKHHQERLKRFPDNFTIDQGRKWRKLSDECTAADVSAALVTAAGHVYRGVSISAACGIGFCGETSAIAQMVTDGETRITKIVALSGDGKLMPPCGRCRELLYQIDRGNLETEVLLEGGKSTLLGDLLPVRWQDLWR